VIHSRLSRTPIVPIAIARLPRFVRSRALRLTVPLVAASAAAALLVPVPAVANPAGPHDPFGHVDSISAPADGQLTALGWAAEPDAVGGLVTVLGLVDGRVVTSTVTNVARPDVARIRHTGPRTGFRLTMAVPTTGIHTACIAARNFGSGVDTVLRCVPTPLGTVLTAAQTATHNPVGKFESASMTATGLRVVGWAGDLDYRIRPVTVVLYLDGRPARTLYTSLARPLVSQKYGVGPKSGYAPTVSVAPGAHLVCVWLVNIGLGKNVLSGCRAVDTRGVAGSGTVTVPTVNKKVVAEANRHLGQRYVWGAAGPTTFDCSGLVQYSYRIAGRTTPRIAADQFTAARVIPASRAVPGDLVFYHDAVGSVYHVGIYIGNGMTDAAVDEANGVRHQAVWSPTAATYGSFTHT
jgi:hypothetical protein